MALLLTVVRVPTGRDTGEQYQASCTPLPAAARGTLQACLNTAKSFVDQWPAPVKDAGAQVGEVQDFGDGAPGFHFILKQVAFCGPAGGRGCAAAMQRVVLGGRKRRNSVLGWLHLRSRRRKAYANRGGIRTTAPASPSGCIRVLRVWKPVCRFRPNPQDINSRTFSIRNRSGWSASRYRNTPWARLRLSASRGSPPLALLKLVHSRDAHKIRRACG